MTSPAFSPTSTDTHRRLALAAFALLLVLHTLYFLDKLDAPRFTPDSWTYYEYSRSVFSGDFFHVNTTRQFALKTEYGISFPPLLPLFVALVNKARPMGIYAEYFLNFALYPLTALLLLAIGRRAQGSTALGVFLAAVPYMNKSYIDELLSGRSMPAALFLFSLLFFVYLFMRRSQLFEVLLGLLAGPIRMQYYFPPGTEFPSVWSAPLDWFVFSMGKVLTMIRCYVPLLVTQSPFLILLAALAVLLGKPLLAGKWAEISPDHPEPIARAAHLIPIFLISYLSIFLTGRCNERYFVLHNFYVTALLALTLYSRRVPKKLAERLLVILCFVILAMALSWSRIHPARALNPSHWHLNQDYLTADEFRPILNAIEGEKTRGLFDRRSRYEGYKFGALTGLPTIVLPLNYYEGRRLDLGRFIEDYAPPRTWSPRTRNCWTKSRLTAA